MGHLINPISNRIAVNSYWNSNWALNNTFNYINVFKQDFLLFQFLDWFTKKSKFGKFNIIISHYKVFRLYNKVYINFYYYNAGLEEKKYHFQVKSLVTLLKQKEKLRRVKKYQLNNTEFHNVSNSLTEYNEQSNSSNISKTKIRSLYIHIIKLVISNLYWYLINKSLKFYLNKLSNNQDVYSFNIYSLDFLNVTTDIISTYISLKLQQKYSLNWVLRPILKDLSSKIKSKVFLGYKIVCSGRFTRKQIATYMWMKEGSLKLNNFSSLVKYSQSSVKLKYGLCGIKVWLNYGHNDLNLFKRNLLLVYPAYTPFKYVIDFKSKSLILHLNYWFFLYFKMCSIKSKFYNFYQLFVNIKIKILLKYVFKKIFKKVWLNQFQIKQLESNKIAITAMEKPYTYFPFKRI
jgi:hypothetical protein